jgi:tetratricopeptide (TPR) repeat protein
MDGASTVRDTGTPGGAKVVAVVSAVGSTGCTSAVANLAFALATAGRRVLVLDWGSDVPRVNEYLEPFYVKHAPLPAAIADSVLVAHSSRPVERGEQPSPLTRYTLPEVTGYIDVVTPPGDGTADTYPNLDHGGLGAIANLRRELPRAGYDDVLIDAPTGSIDASLKVVATLCDIAVVSFRPRPRAIQDAAELIARLRRYAPIDIRLVPLATAFDDEYRPRVERIRGLILSAFADLPNSGAAIEIPFRAYDSFDPLLNILVEEEADSRLLAGYEQLVREVTGGAIATLTPLSPALRARYRRVFGLDSTVEPDRVLVAYASPDRPWADWVRRQLTRVGAQTRTLAGRGDWLDGQRPPGLVVVYSAHTQDLPADAPVATEVLDLLARAKEAGRPLNVFYLRVDNTPAPPGTTVAIAPGVEQESVVRLLNHFGLIDRPNAEPTRQLRLPDQPPPIFDAPPRHPGFVGRDNDLERLRDLLTETGNGSATVTIGGVPGVGKSELALEYAYRFAGDYDLVWWIPAGDEQSIMVSLARLADELDERDAHDFGTTVALDRLATDRAHTRFLLIYDNVDDPAGLDDLLPSEHRGHVVITSNAPGTDGITLLPMEPDDSARLLGRQVSGLSAADAGRVARAVGQLPIALGLVGAWLGETVATERRAGASLADAATWATRAFLENLGEEPTGEVPWQLSVRRAVTVVVESLRRTPTGRVALMLARMCVYLSPDGISLSLVRSPAMLDQLAEMGGDDADPLREDAAEIDRALWIGARHGVFRIDWGKASSLRVHRVVQNSLGDAMTEQERSAYRTATLTTLAAFAPTEVEDQTSYYATRFLELQKHVFPSGAIDGDDPAVRRWLVNQVNFLFTRGPGVRRATIAPAEKLLESWNSRFPPADLLRSRLTSLLAEFHLALGDHSRALRLQDSTLAVLRRSLTLTHPRVLVAARGRGGALRGLGLFTESVEEDQATWAGFRDELGDDHPNTRKAAHNLASAMFLSGDVHGALAMAESNYRQRRRLLGEDDPTTWSPLIQIGVFRRELGDYENASEALRLAGQHLRDLHLGLNPLEVAVRWHQAITSRRDGDARAAKERNGQALRDFRELLGPDHPNTLACTLSFAAASRAVGGEPGLAVELAESVLAGYRNKARLAEQHPFVALARLGLGLAKSSVGQDGSTETAAALALLRGRLGETHPWALAAAVDHARVLATRARTDEAARLLVEAHDHCLELLGRAHPHTVVAGHNLKIVEGRPDGPDGETWREIDVDIPES